MGIHFFPSLIGEYVCVSVSVSVCVCVCVFLFSCFYFFWLLHSKVIVAMQYFSCFFHAVTSKPSNRDKLSQF